MIRQDIKSYVEGFAKLGAPTPIHEAVLKHGHEYSGATFKQFPEYSTPKECYANALHLSQFGYGEYVEGFVISPCCPLLISHAWLVHDGQVIEPTLTARDGCEYMGITIPDAADLLENFYGIFDSTDFIESLGYPSTRWLK